MKSTEKQVLGQHQDQKQEPSSTLLTPAMARLGKSAATCNKGQIRHLIGDALDKQLYSTAIFYSERLSRSRSATISDHILFAKCFLLSGEHRRCLATLQHRGLLQVTVIGPLGDALRPPSQSAPTSFLTPVQLQHLAAVHLAACCLHHLREFEDCLSLLESLVHLEQDGRDEREGGKAAARCLSLLARQATEIHVMAALYCLVGKCYDALDHRSRALRAFRTALRIDPACTEAAEHMCRRGMLSQQEKQNLLQAVIVLDDHPGKEWLQPFYSFLLGDEPPECLDLICPDEEGREDADATEVSALSLVMRAEHLYQHGCMEDAFRVAGQAYLIDPYDWRGTLVYIGTMVDLSLKNELFYLGHELVHSHPKHAIAWYTVGCYYWTCQKLELAQKYLQKTTKIDKRFAHAWVLLGNVLAAQEESEHAVSAFRTACRVAPGDLHPQIAMAKELVRTSNFSLALHVLSEARARCPSSPAVLNELGVVYMQLNRFQEAMQHLRKAAEAVIAPTRSIDSSRPRRGGSEGGGVVEILSNYGTCLRKCGMLEQALEWYQRCLAYRPNDAMTHANLGFTLHLSRRFDAAVDQYHRALSLQPAFSFCSDLLTQALSDLSAFPPLPSSSSSASGRATTPQASRGVFQQSHVIDALFMPPPVTAQPGPGVGRDMESCEDFERQEGEALGANTSMSLLSQYSAIPEQRPPSSLFNVTVTPDGGVGGHPLHNSPFKSPEAKGQRRERDSSCLSGGQDSSGQRGSGGDMSWDEEGMQSESEDDSRNEETYSRVAGRLSMSSVMSDMS